MDRRSFLAVGVLAVSGCAAVPQLGDKVQDSDGDGVLDPNDYAPSDPEVQEKSDLVSPTPRPSTARVGNASQGGGSAADTTPATVDPPSEVRVYDETKTVPAPGYFHLPVAFDTGFTLDWTATNRKAPAFGFDVFLMVQGEFETYVNYLDDESGPRPEYVSAGSAQGITGTATRTVTLDSGTYRLVVDNTGYGDAGSGGGDAARKVRLKLVAESA